MFSQKTIWSRSSITDTILLIVLFFGINLLFAPRDPGWTSLNPSPALLLPILMGCRYGFGAGVITALITAFIVLMMNLFGGKAVADALQTNGVLFAGLLVVGGLCGEITNNFRKRFVEQTAESQRATEKLKTLDRETFILREQKEELEKLVATMNGEIATLDTEIRRLFETDLEELYNQLLLLFNRQARITDAAVYLEKNGAWVRAELLGSGQFLPESLDLAVSKIAARALETRQLVTVADFWQTTKKDDTSGALMAVPFVDSQDGLLALVLVAGIPFISFNKRTVELVHLISLWGSRVLELKTRTDTYKQLAGAEQLRLYTPKAFQENLRLVLRSYERHGIPSAIVTASWPGQSGCSQSEFCEALLEQIRGGDFPVELGLPFPAMAVLLPLTTERGVQIFLQRIQHSLQRKLGTKDGVRYKTFYLKNKKTAQEIWKELNDEQTFTAPS